MSGSSAQAERVRASGGESRGSARSAGHAAERRDQSLVTDTIRHWACQQTGVDRERRSRTQQGKVASTLRGDEAKWARRRRIMMIVGGCRLAARTMSADDKAVWSRRREGSHAEPDACHQGLNCKRVGDPKRQETARPPGLYKLSQAEHRLINSTRREQSEIHGRGNTSLQSGANRLHGLFGFSRSSESFHPPSKNLKRSLTLTITPQSIVRRL
jgi:hypothetical protein